LRIMKKKIFLAISCLLLAVGCLSAQVSYTSDTTNFVTVTYNGTNNASVVIASNVKDYVTATVSGGTVSIVQASTVSASTCGEIIYNLTGTSTNGTFYMEGSYKATVEMNGLTLTNPSGPAINIMNGKRIELSAKKGTTNTLTDGTSTETDAWKGAFYCKGHTEFKGKGTLNVYGNYAHAIFSKEYMSVKNCTINVYSAVKDAIHCKEYFLMESGEVNLSGFLSDGIECNIDGTVSTGETTDHEDEDSGNIYLLGGTLTIDMSSSSGESIKQDGTKTVSADATVTVSGTSGVNNVQGNVQSTKVLRDGVLYVEKNGKTYNTAGTEVR